MRSIRDIFKNMEYGAVLENLDEGKEWIKHELPKFNDKYGSNEKIFLINKIEEESENLGFVFKEYRCKAQFPIQDGDFSSQMNRLVDEILKNQNLIVQTEILVRGISAKDTKQNIHQMVEYFRYFANFIQTQYVRKDHNNSDELLWGVDLMSIAKIIVQILHPNYKTNYFTIPSDSLVITILLISIVHKLRFSTTFHLICFEEGNYVKPKSSMVIFENSDLNSVCGLIPSAAWSHQASLPWCLNTVLIQETVYETFTEKLKENLSKVRIGRANDKQADITYPTLSFCGIKNSKQILEIAKTKGFDTYTSKVGFDDFSPTLIFARKNQIIPESTDSWKYQRDLNLYVTSFRTINEAISLINNEQLPIISVSIWSEHIGTVNEISKKLQVNNIWINSFGLFSPYLQMDYPIFHDIGYLDEKMKITQEAQNKWKTEFIYIKIQIFRKIIHYLKENTAFCEDFYNDLTNYINHTHKQQTLCHKNDYQIISYKEPIGIIILNINNEELTEMKSKTFLLILKTIFDGNAVVVTVKSDSTLIELSNILPKNLLITLESSNLSKSYVKGVQMFHMADLQFKESLSFTKCIWQNMGETFY